MEKKNQRAFGRLIIFAIVWILIGWSIGIMAYTSEKERPELATGFKMHVTSATTPVIPVSQDTCLTDTLHIGTGFDYLGNTVYAVGVLDNYWTVTCVPQAFPSNPPYPANVIGPLAAWDGPLPNSQWIAPHPAAQNYTNGVYCYEFDFCVADTTGACLYLEMLVDDDAVVFLNGVQIFATGPNPYNCVPQCFFQLPAQVIDTCGIFQVGINTLRVEVTNRWGVASGLNISGVVIAPGAGVVEEPCCDSTGAIAGIKWNDVDGDCDIDSNETVLSGWTIIAAGSSDTLSTQTDSFGYYFFTDLTPGIYTIKEVIPSGWTPTCPPGGSLSVVVPANGVIGGINFGNQRESFYWKPPYEDYAPNGMPDLDQKQDDWRKEGTDQWSFCGPVAVANCFKWFDSKYNVPPGVPGDGQDQFPLVRQYIDALGGMLGGYDDHDPWNMNHPATPWQFGATTPPPPTPQPFVPGPQPPGMPPWGELVERLAWYFNTDGVQTGYCNHTGTNIMEMQEGIAAWFASEIFEDGSTLADSLCEVTLVKPTFATVESLVEKCEDVILLLGFWYEDAAGRWWRIGGHYVTVAGVSSQNFQIAFSDPFIDNAEAGGPGRVGDGSFINHPHGSHDPRVHNDEGNVSHDIYTVDTASVSPGGVWWLPDYPASTDPYSWVYIFFSQNLPDEFQSVTAPWDGSSEIHTEVEYAVHISPWDYRGDVNGDGVVDLGDVVFLINYLFKGGPAPAPLLEGDVNCDGVIDLGDVVFLINYLFKGGNVPRCCDP